MNHHLKYTENSTKWSKGYFQVPVQQTIVREAVAFIHDSEPQKCNLWRTYHDAA